MIVKAIAKLVVVMMCSIAAAADAQEIVTLPTRPGVTQSYSSRACRKNLARSRYCFPDRAD